MPEQPVRRRLLALAAGGCCLAAAAMGQLGKAPLATGSFLVVYALAFVPYGLAVYLVFKRKCAPSLASVLLIAALLRLLVYPALPSDDLNRYVWEGRVQQEGFNPYLLAPSDPRLIPLRDEIWRGVNRLNEIQTAEQSAN